MTGFREVGKSLRSFCVKLYALLRDTCCGISIQKVPNVFPDPVKPGTELEAVQFSRPAITFEKLNALLMSVF